MALKPNPLKPDATPSERAAHERAERDCRENPHLWGNGPEHQPGPLRDAMHHTPGPADPQAGPTGPGSQGQGSRIRGK